jgi:hypothetical protein
MRVTDGDAIAPGPLADVLAIAAAKLIALAIDVVDDVALFGTARFDRGGRHFSNFNRGEGYAALQGATRQSDGQRRRPQDPHGADRGDGCQNRSIRAHLLALLCCLRRVS